MDEYKSRLSTYLSDMVREELEKYDSGFTDEWNDQRKKNAEVLGYKLSGTSDISEGVKDPKLKVGQKIRYKNDSRRLYTLKKITHGNRGIPEDPAGTSYMFVAPGNRKEYHTKKTWAQAIKKGWLSLESVNEEITDWQGKYNDEFKFKKGQLIRDINPDCPHHGSEGEVTKVTKDEVTYTVRNNGKTYKVGDELTKTKDQLTPLSIKESINEAKRGTDLYFVIDQLVNSMEHYDEREFIKHIGKETKYSSPQLKKLYKSYYKLSPRKRFSMSFNWEKWLKNQGISETSERDYKSEYKKFQSSTKSKKYRAELNQYNRKKGTYGNNDGKDASHKGGKIVGFEKESTNRGRREKSRLKKEAILKLRQMIREELIIVDKRNVRKEYEKIGYFAEGEINEINQSQAKILLKQLGGGKFIAMTGAKDFGIGKDGLHFKIGRNSKGVSHVRINYNRGRDLYDMAFLAIRMGKVKIKKQIKGLYADQLGEIFEKYTGLYTRL